MAALCLGLAFVLVAPAAARALPVGAAPAGGTPAPLPPAPQRLVDALSEQGMDNGSLEGMVLDFDGTPLPGVTVHLVGPEPSEDERTTISDEEAHYEFVGLTPGIYRITVELSSVEALGNLEVTVRPGMRVTTDLELSLMGTDVTVKVQAVARAIGGILSQGTLSGQSRVEYDTLNRLPLPAEQALEVLPLIPTVLRDLEDNISIGGTYPSDAILLFNGMDLMDPFTGNFRLRLPLESVEDVNVFSGVYPATYGDVSGGLVNVSTRPGGDEWAWRVSSLFPRPNFNNGGIEGVGNASPRIFVGGPVGSGGLFLAQSVEYHYDKIKIEEVAGHPEENQITTQGWEWLTQFDWYPNDDHRLRFLLLAFPGRDQYVGLDGVTPREATSDVERDGEIILASHRWTMDARNSLQWSFQINRVGVGTSVQGPAPLEVTPDGLEGNFYRTEDRQTTHTQAKAIYGRSMGSGANTHQVEIGGEFHSLDITGAFDAGTILTRGAEGQLLRRSDFFGSPEDLDETKYEWAGFIHDRWWQGTRFWCDLGLRYSSDSITQQTRWEPRVGFAWDPIGDSDTLIKAAAGVLHRRVYLAESYWDQGPVLVQTNYGAGESGEDILHIFVPEIAEQLEAPRTLLVTAEAIHRFSPSLLVRGRYSHRDGDDQIIFDLVPGAGIRVPEGVAPLDVGHRAAPDTYGKLLLSNEGKRNSWSAEITGQYTLSNSSDIYGSYVYSSAEGDLNEFSRLAGERPDPVLRPNAYARLPFDAPHRFLLWGVVSLPWGLTVSPVVEWRTGFPYSVVAEDQSYLGPANSARYPDFLSIDARIMKDLTIKNYDIQVGVKITNLTNHDNPRNVINNVASERFGELLNSRGLKIRAAFSLGF